MQARISEAIEPDDARNGQTQLKDQTTRFVGTEASMTLATLPHGAAARVVSVAGSESATLRLIEMGIAPGASIRVVKAAPFGDPIQICLRNYHLALRLVDAERISVVTGS